MNQRKRRLNDVCRHLAIVPISEWLSAAPLDHIIVDDQHQILYCYVPKVACTNWKRIMMILRDFPTTIVDPLKIPEDVVHNPNYNTLDKHSLSEILYRLKYYFKFMFARYPLERLVSAYRDTFQQNYSDYFHQNFGTLIVQRHRFNASDESRKRGHDVTFEEFVEYLLDPLTSREAPLDDHWKPIFQLCHPCHIPYDIIGKYDTLVEDAKFVLHRAHVPRWVYFPEINKTVDTSALVSQFIGNLTFEKREQLRRMYELDFAIFGYENTSTFSRGI